MNLKRVESLPYHGGEEDRASEWISNFPTRHPKADLDNVFCLEGTFIILTYYEKTPDDK